MRSTSTSMRAVGMTPFETIMAAREEYRGVIDIQLVAFPQNGEISCPGTAEPLDAAVAGRRRPDRPA